MPESYAEKPRREKLTLSEMDADTVYAVGNGIHVFKAPGDLETYGKEGGVADRIDDVESMERTLSIPYTGIGSALPESGAVRDALRSFGVYRLENIPQLARLSDPDNDPDIVLTLESFTHTRFTHTLDVTGLASIIGYNNGLSEKEQTILQLAALTHDTLTPAGGDTTKLIDREAFDEDKQYPTLFHKAEIAAFCESHGIDTKLLTQTVLNDGPLGKMLDFSDKLAYTTRDADQFIGPQRPGEPRWQELPARSIVSRFVADEMARKGNRDICSVWESMVVTDDQLVCTDPAQLHTFLKLRALMFKNLYTNPLARFNESLVVSLFTQYLYETGQIKREALLDPVSGVDEELQRLIHDEFDITLSSFWYHDFAPTYETFESEAAARVFEQELLASGKAIVRYEDASRFFKPATDLPVSVDGTNPQPLKTAYPGLAEDIEMTGRVDDPYRVYFLADEKRPDTNSWRHFAQWRRERVDL